MSRRSLILSLIAILCHPPFLSGDATVTTTLYSNATLPCAFPFVRGAEDLTIVWVKVEEDGSEQLVLRLVTRDNRLDQSAQYRGRTELSKDFSHGNLNLMVSGVTTSDVGTYYCRAANGRGHGDNKVQLSISGLTTEGLAVTVIRDQGSRCLKCSGCGLLRNPQVLWYTRGKVPLPAQATLTVTSLADGRKRVESVLPNVEKNKQYLCDIAEGGLHQRVRAVISDGRNPVKVPETH